MNNLYVENFNKWMADVVVTHDDNTIVDLVSGYLSDLKKELEYYEDKVSEWLERVTYLESLETHEDIYDEDTLGFNEMPFSEFMDLFSDESPYTIIERVIEDGKRSWVEKYYSSDYISVDEAEHKIDDIYSCIRLVSKKYDL